MYLILFLALFLGSASAGEPLIVGFFEKSGIRAAFSKQNEWWIGLPASASSFPIESWWFGENGKTLGKVQTQPNAEGDFYKAVFPLPNVTNQRKRDPAFPRVPAVGPEEEVRPWIASNQDRLADPDQWHRGSLSMKLQQWVRKDAFERFGSNIYFTEDPQHLKKVAGMKVALKQVRIRDQIRNKDGEGWIAVGFDLPDKPYASCEESEESSFRGCNPLDHYWYQIKKGAKPEYRLNADSWIAAADLDGNGKSELFFWYHRQEEDIYIVVPDNGNKRPEKRLKYD